jgi:hypothetical protein
MRPIAAERDIGGGDGAAGSWVPGAVECGRRPRTGAGLWPSTAMVEEAVRRRRGKQHDGCVGTFFMQKEGIVNY